MKRLALFTATLALLWGLTALTSYAQGGPPEGFGPGTFVDADGDGIRDNAPDADGDGVPNGRDADYVPVNPDRGHQFVDADGDGINDNAPDSDGDGIPNGRDADTVRPQDGTGKRTGWLNRVRDGIGGLFQRMRGQRVQQHSVVAAPQVQAPDNAVSKKSRFGAGDGTGFSGVGPADGTGNGAAIVGQTCDGTGPKQLNARR